MIAGLFLLPVTLIIKLVKKLLKEGKLMNKKVLFAIHFVIILAIMCLMSISTYNKVDAGAIAGALFGILEIIALIFTGRPKKSKPAAN